MDPDLNVKPSCIRRLGQTNNYNTPRRVMVILDAEDQINEIMRKAKRLRTSTYARIANGVYINRDLNIEENRAAFVRRWRRKNPAGESRDLTPPPLIHKRSEVDSSIAPNLNRSARLSGGGRSLVFTRTSSNRPIGLVSQHLPVNTTDTSTVYHTTHQHLVPLDPNASSYPPPPDCDDLQSFPLLP